MDFIEYTNRRIVLADQKTLALILGYSFIGAGIILLLSMVKTERYFFFGLMLEVVGIGILYFSKERSYVTFDAKDGVLEIQRNPILGRMKLEQYSFGDITGIRTEKSPKAKNLAYRVAIQIQKGNWIPLTNPYQKDEYGYETTEGKLRAFLEASEAPLVS